MSNQNIGNIGNHKIYFAQADANRYGSVTGNRYYPMSGIGFINNYDPSYTTVSSNDSVQFYTAREWEFNMDGNAEGWIAANQITGVAVSGGYYSGTVTGADPNLLSQDNLNLDLSTVKLIKIRMKNSTAGSKGQIYFTTTADTGWNDAKHKDFVIVPSDSNYTEYTLDMTGVSGWTGTLKQLRVDPDADTTGGSFSIDYIRLGNAGAPTMASVAKAWEFNTNGNKEGWTPTNQITSDSVSGGYYSGSITGTDPYMLSSDNLGINIGSNKLIKIRMRNSTTATTGQIYFTTTTDGSWNDAKHKDFILTASDPGYTEYLVDMSSVAGWTGTLKQLRLDPSQASGSFSIDYIRVTGA